MCVGGLTCMVYFINNEILIINFFSKFMLLNIEVLFLLMLRKCEGDIRSVMPFDVLDGTRATMLLEVSVG